MPDETFISFKEMCARFDVTPVSYTHLKLPTKA